MSLELNLVNPEAESHSEAFGVHPVDLDNKGKRILFEMRTGNPAKMLETFFNEGANLEEQALLAVEAGRYRAMFIEFMENM
jgi:hypothetical protein